jgi:hypothetical protein
MSKNSSRQNIECLKGYIKALEIHRKKMARSKPKHLIAPPKYHPALDYDEDE